MYSFKIKINFQINWRHSLNIYFKDIGTRFVENLLVSRCDPHGRFTKVEHRSDDNRRSDDTGGAALAARRVIQRMTKIYLTRLRKK